MRLSSAQHREEIFFMTRILRALNFISPLQVFPHTWTIDGKAHSPTGITSDSSDRLIRQTRSWADNCHVRDHSTGRDRDTRGHYVPRFRLPSDVV